MASKKKNRRKVGRPTVFTDIVMQKIEQGYSVGYNTTEVALYADISRETLSKRLRENKQFSDRIEALKSRPSLRAKALLFNALQNDVATARWYLERTQPEEYGARSHVQVQESHKLIFEDMGDDDFE